jgi:hypothetical protein
MPWSGAVWWTVVGDDLLPVPPVESFLSYLAAMERSPLTVRTYAHDLVVLARQSMSVRSSLARSPARSPACAASVTIAVPETAVTRPAPDEQKMNGG